MGPKTKGIGRGSGVRNLAVSRWERGERRISALLPLALEALEHRMKTGGGKDGRKSPGTT